MSAAGQVARILQNPALSHGLFDRFMKTGSTSKLFAALAHGFFWQQGDYRLECVVEVAGRAQPVCCAWSFSLTEREENDLRLHVISVIRDLCNLPVVYNFAYKPYANALGGPPNKGPEVTPKN